MSAVLLVVLSVVTLAGCGNSDPDVPLKVAVLPILDSLPLYVAVSEGLFEAEGVEVELVPVSSAAERDQLFQSGQVDAVITDLVALVLANRDQPQLVAVRYAMVPTPDYAQFRILASPNAHVSAPSDLAGKEIGVSEGTVIEYVTHTLLRKEGLRSDQIETLAVPKIPDRMALLAGGGLTAATLPEPLGTLAQLQGATVVVDDSAHPETSCSIVAVRASLTTDRREAVAGLVQAIDRASTAVNADKAAWGDLLGERNLIPPPLAGGYTLPHYPGAEVPTQAQYLDVAAWLRETERLETSPAYDEVVTDEFVR